MTRRNAFGVASPNLPGRTLPTRTDPWTAKPPQQDCPAFQNRNNLRRVRFSRKVFAANYANKMNGGPESAPSKAKLLEVSTPGSIFQQSFLLKKPPPRLLPLI